MISIKDVVNLVLVVLTLKLIVTRWEPPIQESKQALICITLGLIMALAIDFSIEGFVTGVIGSGIAFYGKDLLNEFNNTKENLKETDYKEG